MTNSTCTIRSSYLLEVYIMMNEINEITYGRTYSESFKSNRCIWVMEGLISI